MRLFCFIFALYVAALAVMPCGDNEDCTQSKLQIELADDHSEHEHESEMCTPFCICSCCGTSLQVANIFNFEIVTAVTSKPLPTSYTDSIQEISLSIWQPPQLG